MICVVPPINVVKRIIAEHLGKMLVSGEVLKLLKDAGYSQDGQRNEYEKLFLVVAKELYDTPMFDEPPYNLDKNEK
jgi:hypothetical protein